MEVDWMGKWYDIIRERGENDSPTLGKYNLSNGQIEWIHFSHSQMDGVGALFHHYEKCKDFNIGNLKYPALKEKKAPSFFDLIPIFFRLFFKTKKLKTIWKEENLKIEPIDSNAISLYIFSEEETVAIEQHCQMQKFSPNAFFMNTMTHFLLEKLSLNQEGTWTLPVNLRPLLKREDFKSNHSSAILVNINKSDGPKETHQKISQNLKQKQHWGIWWIHQVGRIIGIKGMRYISDKNAKRNFMLGSFTYLSSWELPMNDIWVGSPPGSKNFPLSIMLMKSNKRFSLSLKIHPFVLREQEKAEQYFNSLINHILEKVDK